MPITRVDPFNLQDADVYHRMNGPGVKRVLAEGDSWLSIFLPRDGNLRSGSHPAHP